MFFTDGEGCIILERLCILLLYYSVHRGPLEATIAAPSPGLITVGGMGLGSNSRTPFDDDDDDDDAFCTINTYCFQVCFSFFSCCVGA